jgi:tetratricopeptide (TPR) repeat protein
MGAIAISLIHVLPPLFASRNVLVGAERLSMLASSSSPWDIRGRASSLEQTAGFYLNTGDTLSAAGQLAKAWKVRPNPLYLGAAGTYYAGIRRYDLAETQFKTLVDARPSDKEANLSLGIVYALSGDFEKAKPHFLIAYGDTSLVLPEPEIDTTDWVDWPHGPERERVRTQRWKARTESQKTFLEGEKAARSGDLAQAEQLYRKALEIYPRWGRMQYEAHCHIGTVCSMRGQVREAAYEYLLALNSYGRYPLCYFIANGVAYGPVRRSIPGATGPGTDMHIQ